MEREQIRDVLLRLEAAGFEAWLVGGCVRDRLMGLVPHDYDITTSARPEEVMAVFSGCRVLETGLKHGTVTLLHDGEPLEITTFRAETGYSDHRHPDEVRFTRSLRDDLSRRDFTMNSIAMDARGAVYDPFGGAADIAAGRIRAVGDSARRFEEDALRILRGLRFSAVLGFAIDGETRAAMEQKKELLRYVSAERCLAELTKLLCGQNVRPVLLENAHILGAVLPELLPMAGFDQRNYHHIYDVLEHTARVVENVPPVPALRWAALLHDAGKPRCFTQDAAGVGHFYGHAELGRQLAAQALGRLRADNATRKTVDELIRCHDTPIEPTEKAVRRALARLTPEGFTALMQLKRADNLAQSPDFRGRQQEYDRIEAVAADLLAHESCFSLRSLAVNGRDLMALGIPAGPGLGQLLNELFEAVLSGRLPNERACLLAEAQRRAAELP